MKQALRTAVVQVTMVITMAVSAVVAIPLVNKYSQQRVEQAVKASPSGKIEGSRIFTAAIYPQLATVLACVALSLIVGFVLAKKLPPAVRSRDRLPRKQ